MKLYTIQMAKWRKAKGELLDITIKSGNRTFAPTWELVRDIKNGDITEEEYRDKYIDLMRKSYKHNREEWLDLLDKDEVTLACYCPSGNFCHRNILKDLLIMLGQFNYTEVDYCGELE